MKRGKKMRKGNPFPASTRSNFRIVRGPISGRRLFDYDPDAGTLEFAKGGVTEKISLQDLLKGETKGENDD